MSTPCRLGMLLRGAFRGNPPAQGRAEGPNAQLQWLVVRDGVSPASELIEERTWFGCCQRCRKVRPHFGMHPRKVLIDDFFFPQLHDQFSLGFATLLAVAGVAAKLKVVDVMRAAFRLRHNMIDGEILQGEGDAAAFARSEAHDSGLCAADSFFCLAFASDMLNLTFASPQVNRDQKGGRDVAEWLPALNQCWYVNRVVAVKRRYGLSMDAREAQAALAVLADCPSVAMEIVAPAEAPPAAAAEERSTTSAASADSGVQSGPQAEGHPLELYDDNGNGRITCAEARAHGIALVRSDHPAYQYMRDPDGDGVVCE